MNIIAGLYPVPQLPMFAADWYRCSIYVIKPIRELERLHMHLCACVSLLM